MPEKHGAGEHGVGRSKSSPGNTSARAGTGNTPLSGENPGYTDLKDSNVSVKTSFKDVCGHPNTIR